jgi:hypothetical protein
VRNRSLLLVLVSCLVFAGPAPAQEPPRKGLTLAYPASVGLLWPLRPKIALRPELTGSRLWADSTRTSQTGQVTDEGSSGSWSVGAGLSSLLYVRQWEGLRGYFAPRFAYTRSTTSSELSDNTVSQYSFSGSFGLECALHRHFAVFAELGAAYTLQKSTNTSYPSSSGITPVYPIATGKTQTVAPRSGIGAIVYF